MRPDDTTRYWAIDAGGSSTTAVLDDGTRWRTGSVNPASAGAAAESELLRLFGFIGEAIGTGWAAGWLATATLDVDAPTAEVDRLAGLAVRAGITGVLVISRDVLPLLLAPPLRGRGVAVVCGTGSGFVASDGHCVPVSIGGCEYLGSDEGSAFDLGLAGLRAAVRGDDGRGLPTTLGAVLAEPFAGSVRDLARALAAGPFPKAAVAGLAPLVTRCWLAGDRVAGTIVAEALDELVLGVRVARDAAGLTDPWSVVLSGGVFRGCPEFAAALSERLGTQPATLVDDPAATVLSALRQWPAHLPSTVDERWAWRRNLGGQR